MHTFRSSANFEVCRRLPAAAAFAKLIAKYTINSLKRKGLVPELKKNDMAVIVSIILIRYSINSNMEY